MNRPNHHDKDDRDGSVLSLRARDGEAAYGLAEFLRTRYPTAEVSRRGRFVGIMRDGVHADETWVELHVLLHEDFGTERM